MRVAVFALVPALILTSGVAWGGARPTASVASAPDTGFQGVWRGVITGRDFGTTGGVVQKSAVLTIEPGGRWALVERQGGSEQRSSGTARTVGARLILDGTVSSGGPTGAPVAYVVTRGPGQAFYGNAETFFSGHRVLGDIRAQRATSGSGPSALPREAVTVPDGRSPLRDLPIGRTGEMTVTQ